MAYLAGGVVPIPPARPAALAAGASGSGLVAPPLAPAKPVTTLYLSSDDDSDVELPAPKRRKRSSTDPERAGGGGGTGDKGKGKARDEADEVILDDGVFLDSDNDLVMDEFAAPAAGPSNAFFRSPSPPAPAADAQPAQASSSDAAYDAALATVTSILPGVSPSHVADLLKDPVYGPGNVELVLDALFALEGKYPKRDEAATGKGKGKETPVEEEQNAEEEDEEIERRAKQYVETEGRKAGGKAYEDLALAQLYDDFPTIQQANIKRIFQSASSFYAPAYLAAQKALQQTEAERGFKLMAVSTRARASKGKGKANDEFEREHKWVVEELARYRAVQARAVLTAKKLEEEIASGAFFECGCCFTDCALSQMVTCLEGCAFCKDCARMNAESQIGMRKFVLPCMSTSGCTSTFPDREAGTYLSRKTLAALHKIRSEKEIGGAEIEGLKQCPFCPFAYIVENPDERLFHCQRDDCGIVSCLQCQKKDHLPKTCAEVDDDAKISTVHRVEEAMSAALIRRCPKPGCGEPYIKENGTCNKITCSSCRTLSCYICNAIISDVGYRHFKNAGSNAPGGSVAGATCDLWDDTATRNFQEVEAARMAAEAEARKENPGVTDEDLNKLRMDQPGAPHHLVAHLAAPRVAAYDAVLGLHGGDAAPAARAPPGRAARAAAAVPAYAYNPRMPAYDLPARAGPLPAALNAQNLAALGRQARDDDAAKRRREMDERLRLAQERRRVTEDIKAKQRVAERERAEAERKRRKEQEDARAARRERTRQKR
ncbi:hypothetical protein JCM10207_002762 [Rhodosporidiobolus poonsookiae]